MVTYRIFSQSSSIGLLTFETEIDDSTVSKASVLDLTEASDVSRKAPPASASPQESVVDFGTFNLVSWLKQNTFYVVSTVLACRHAIAL